MKSSHILVAVTVAACFLVATVAVVYVQLAPHSRQIVTKKPPEQPAKTAREQKLEQDIAKLLEINEEYSTAMNRRSDSLERMAWLEKKINKMLMDEIDRLSDDDRRTAVLAMARVTVGGDLFGLPAEEQMKLKKHPSLWTLLILSQQK